MQTCNLKSMKQSKITNLLIVVLLIFSVLIPTINLSAREVEKKRGYKGTISKEKILSTFIKDECVVGHVIKGDDIIEIIKATDHEIRISDSIIEGGLNFTKLPAESWEKVKLPKGWNTQAKQAFIKREFHPENIHIVKNRIDITNSEIRSDSVDRFSINATAALFFKQNSYRNVVFSGEADFSWATFISKAYFSEATFISKAYFSEATFSGEADFRKATFISKADFLKATFSGEPDFLKTTFSDEAYFSWATVSGLPDFQGLADFSEATFSGEANFLKATFRCKADFSEATFSGLAKFSWASFSGWADFRKATFISKAYFLKATFISKADFIKATFSGETNFSWVTFSGDADFIDAIFSSKANFSLATFSGDADFSEATFSSYVNFSEATFSGYAHFSMATFSDEAYFSWATFSGDADFIDAIFSSKADFIDAIFSSKANFLKATFSGEANFLKATFRCKADFSEATFSGLAKFSWASFSGWADFRKATFISKAYFLKATFISKADFIKATFSDETNFSWTTFSGEANFSWATFSGLAYFRSTSFPDALDLRNSKFKEYLDFRNAKIRRLNFNSRISPTILRGRIDFRKSIISEALFQDIIFEDDVDFSDVQFGIPIGTEKDKRLAVIFRFITFQSDAYFIGTNFCGDTAFERVTFKKDSNFTDAIFKGKKSEGKGKLSLSHLHFKNLLIRWSQLPNVDFWVNQTKERIKSFIDVEKEKEEKNKGQKEVESEDQERLEPLSAVLKRLEASFRGHNQLSDANYAYYHKKLAELNEAGRNEGDVWWRCQKRLAWFFWGISCGYGTKVEWILAWCVFFNLLFAIIFSVKGDLKRQPYPITKKEFTFKQRLFDFPKQYLSQTSLLEIGNESVRKFINALRFSSVVLLKIGYRDTTISGKLLGIDYKYIVYIEWVWGFYLLACLAVTLKNRLPIVNKLIAGMF